MPDVKPFTVIAPSVVIGANSIVWNFTTIGEFTQIGDNCAIGSNCYIGYGCRIGNQARLQTGVFLPNRSILEENVFLGPSVICTDDRYPRVGNVDYDAEPPYFEHHCSIGAGAVILPGIRIGAYAMVGAGAVVTRDVRPYETVVGVPSRRIAISEVCNADQGS